ncbi:hypothetical protein PPYR_00079 [Photinus pyralis]|uniref:Core-binding (CB) domain-containing protein n=1 Tax=Photinus pyralis TaxID=7054 RepID=A0A5N4B0I5_PHOPY|nr:hypothetical protein PPYR_00079 [Photinus pyralis]
MFNLWVISKRQQLRKLTIVSSEVDNNTIPESSSPRKQPYLGGLQVIREALIAKGVPECAITTTVRSLTEATIKQYGSTYKLWWTFCDQHDISPFKADKGQVITFFQNLLGQSDNKYGSFNSHRAALSLISPGNIGEDSLFKRFMKGIARARPPKPRYNFTWDPTRVLDYLENRLGDSLKHLSRKLVTLLTLATGQQLQTISLIKLSEIKTHDGGLYIYIYIYIYIIYLLLQTPGKTSYIKAEHSLEK